jgi:hypothetical protein
MDWLESRASISLLHHLKSLEPPLSETDKHAAWEYHYNKFRERVTGFIKLRAAGIVDDPEVVFYFCYILDRAHEVSAKGLRFLKAKKREHLGEAELPPATETVLMPGSEDGA